jgi:hypothetical protein
MSTNFNFLRVVDVQPLQALRLPGNITHNLGYDLSVAFTYRPLDSQNIICQMSGAVLLPANGLRAIYSTFPGLFSNPNFLYATMFNVTLRY